MINIEFRLRSHNFTSTAQASSPATDQVYATRCKGADDVRAFRHDRIFTGARGGCVRFLKSVSVPNQRLTRQRRLGNQRRVKCDEP